MEHKRKIRQICLLCGSKADQFYEIMNLLPTGKSCGPNALGKKLQVLFGCKLSRKIQCCCDKCRNKIMVAFSFFITSQASNKIFSSLLRRNVDGSYFRMSCDSCDYLTGQTDCAVRHYKRHIYESIVGSSDNFEEDEDVVEFLFRHVPLEDRVDTEGLAEIEVEVQITDPKS